MSTFIVTAVTVDVIDEELVFHKCVHADNFHDALKQLCNALETEWKPHVEHAEPFVDNDGTKIQPWEFFGYKFMSECYDFKGLDEYDRELLYLMANNDSPIDLFVLRIAETSDEIYQRIKEA